MRAALILVDIQNDFLPGGALAVPEGDEIVPLINKIQAQFDLVLATQDHHPANHGSFAANHQGRQPGDIIDLDGLSQILWPVHCVQGSHGAAFSNDLDMKRVTKVFTKGENPNIDSYSGFFDNGKRQKTGLGDYLKERGVERVYIVGLATDYCVKFTALDAVDLGFETCVIKDATRAVNLQSGDFEKSLSEMERAGVKVIESIDV
ncbi:bifunctional nicotinamidase/pyrazinamidase [Fulvivirgaceae bacterium BMA12]|uniref:nicotinamidase n=1 Tax=Agaribacillus aureus TaxID=3051825 RepID=A0ABT8L3L3_9BACT|nr:bifunctional nicotinamidase/pyrazinamidase [Fulvivirgaceae bacterium BMA12]